MRKSSEVTGQARSNVVFGGQTQLEQDACLPGGTDVAIKLVSATVTTGSARLTRHRRAQCYGREVSTLGVLDVLRQVPDVRGHVDSENAEDRDFAKDVEKLNTLVYRRKLHVSTNHPGTHELYSTIRASHAHFGAQTRVIYRHPR